MPGEDKGYGTLAPFAPGPRNPVEVDWQPDKWGFTGDSGLNGRFRLACVTSDRINK